MKTLEQVFSAIQMGVTNNKPSDDSEIPFSFIQAKCDETRQSLLVKYVKDTGVVPANCIRIHDGVTYSTETIGGQTRTFFVLPANVLVLDRDKGIFEVWNNARTEIWNPMTSGEYRIMKNMRWSQPSASYPSYQRQGTKVYLYFGSKNMVGYTFSLGLVHLDTSGYGLTEEYPIPQEVMEELIAGTIAKIKDSMTTRMDNANDSADVRTVGNP